VANDNFEFVFFFFVRGGRAAVVAAGDVVDVAFAAAADFVGGGGAVVAAVFFAFPTPRYGRPRFPVKVLPERLLDSRVVVVGLLDGLVIRLRAGDVMARPNKKNVEWSTTNAN